MLQLVVYSPLFAGDTATVEFDPEDGLDTLLFQILSMVTIDADPSELILIDKHGRGVVEARDLVEVKYMHDSGSTCAEVWCMSKASCDPTSFCASILPTVPPKGTPGYAIDVEGIVQPYFSLLGMPYKVCAHCAKYFEADLFDRGSALAQLQSFQCDITTLVDMGIAPPTARDHSTRGVRGLQFASATTNTLPLPVMLYLKKRLMDAALQQLRDRQPANDLSRELQHFHSRLESTARQVLVYEDPQQQAVARQLIDFDKVRAYAEEHLNATLPAQTGAESEGEGVAGDRGGLSEERCVLEDRALLVGLMRWFKLDFFKWCNKPACDNPACRAPPGRMQGVGTVEPSAEEKTIGWAGRTELYRCEDCAQLTRFARFNNPAHLLTTRRGRCGEFANAFCLVLRALRLDARYVLDFTDHVWCEVWLPSPRRYVHCDPCERALDTPLMYESGWNKKLTHVLSFSRHGVCDALPRYSRKQGAVMIRRSTEVVNEGHVAGMIAAKDKELATAYAMRRATSATGDVALPWDPVNEGGDSALTLTTPLRVVTGGVAALQPVVQADLSWPALQQRRRLHERELQALRLSTDLSSTAHCTQGRTSGDLEWRLARGEAGAEPVAGEGETAVKAGAETEVVVPAVKPARTPLPTWLQGLPIGHTLHLPNSSWVCIGDNAAAERTSPCYSFASTALPSPCRDGGVLLRLGGGAGATLRLGNDTDALRALGAPLEAQFTMSTEPVRRICNGIADENASPEYTVVPAHSAAGGAAAADAPMHVVSGYRCALASEVLYPEDANRSVEHMAAVAARRCEGDVSLVGFSVVASAAVAGEAECVLLFTESGYPLVPAAATVHTHLRLRQVDAPAQETSSEGPAKPLCVDSGCLTEALLKEPAPPATTSTADSSTAPLSAVPPKLFYFHLGGACHGDTTAFDSSAYCSDLAASTGVATRLCKITLWAGESLVNGVQCHFEAQCGADTPPVVVSTPACSSDQDSPRAHELALPAGDRVVAVRCRSGALVDSLELATASGQVLRVGGDGGGDHCQIDVPAGMELVGFFGGTGGHLHNLGVVLRPVHIATGSGVGSASAATAQVLALAATRGLQDCGLLCQWGRTTTSPPAQALRTRQWDLGRLVGIVDDLYTRNPPEAVVACLKSITTYVRNILKNPAERKFHIIKLSNAVLRQTVLRCRGGMELLCFGPGVFSLREESGLLVLRSGAADLLAGDRSASFRASYERWLARFVDFLSEVATINMVES